MPAAKNSLEYGFYARIALEPIDGNPKSGRMYEVLVWVLIGDTSGDWTLKTTPAVEIPEVGVLI